MMLFDNNAKMKFNQKLKTKTEKKNQWKNEGKEEQKAHKTKLNTKLCFSLSMCFSSSFDFTTANREEQEPSRTKLNWIEWSGWWFLGVCFVFADAACDSSEYFMSKIKSIEWCREVYI